MFFDKGIYTLEGKSFVYFERLDQMVSMSMVGKVSTGGVPNEIDRYERTFKKGFYDGTYNNSIEWIAPERFEWTGLYAVMSDIPRKAEKYDYLVSKITDFLQV